MVITHPATPTQLDLFMEGLDGEANGLDRITDDELLERIAHCEREDRTLLRMVLAATVATAVLGLAGGLAM
jgi:hypothetical protein